MAGKLTKYWLEAVLVLLICGFIAGQSVYFIHNRLIDEPNGKYYVVLHWQVVNKKAKAPTQYRPLSFWLAEIFTPEVKSKERKVPPSSTQLSDESKKLVRTYLHLRFIFTLLSSLAIYLLFRFYLSPSWAFAGLFYFFALLPFIYQGYMHQPHDPINLFLYGLAYLLIVYGYANWLWPLIIIGMPNRETVMLLPFLDIISHYDERPVWKPLIRFIVYSIVALALYFLIHRHYGPLERGKLPFITLGTNLKHPEWFLPFLFLFGPLILITLTNLKAQPATIKRWLAFGAFFIIFHVVLGRFREVRLLLPVLPIFILSTCISIKALIAKKRSRRHV